MNAMLQRIDGALTLNNAASGACPDIPFRLGNSIERLACNLHALNRQYLSLIAEAESGPSFASSIPIPENLARSLGKLSDAERFAIAECPIALFDLYFDDQARWAQLLTNDRQCRARDQTGSDSRQLALVQAVLFFAWHATQSNTMFVRFALGMHEATARRIATSSVSDIANSANFAFDWLAPRWPRNAYFWPDVVRFAEKNASLQFQASKLLGCQLLAAAGVKAPMVVRESTCHRKGRT
jgi:hypothetical protein